MLVVLVASAVLRMGNSVCADIAYPAMMATLARGVHRISAASIGILLIIIAFFVLRCRPVIRSRIIVLGALCILTSFLAMLGRFTSGNPAPAIVIGNVVAGMALMALFWRMRLEFLPRESYRRPDRQLSVLATSARSLTALQIWLGSWVAGLVAAIGCKPSTSGDELVVWPVAAAWNALNPFRVSIGSIEASLQALNWLTAVHGLSAVLVLAVVAMLCLSLQRSSGGLPRAAPALMILLGIQVTLGITAIFVKHALWIGVLHNAVAALLLLKLIDIHYRLHRT